MFSFAVKLLDLNSEISSSNDSGLMWFAWVGRGSDAGIWPLLEVGL